MFHLLILYTTYLNSTYFPSDCNPAIGPKPTFIPSIEVFIMFDLAPSLRILTTGLFDYLKSVTLIEFFYTDSFFMLFWDIKLINYGAKRLKY